MDESSLHHSEQSMIIMNFQVAHDLQYPREVFLISFEFGVHYCRCAHNTQYVHGIDLGMTVTTMLSEDCIKKALNSKRN